MQVLYPSKWELAWKATYEIDWFGEQISNGNALLLCAVYLVVCFGIKFYLRNKEPFGLKGALAFWNLLLAVFSFMGVVRTAPTLLYRLYSNGVYDCVCHDAMGNYGTGPCGLWACLFCLSKVPELVDTLFIVLRKKPLIFLHWYHHVTVLLYCFHSMATATSIGIFFIVMNYSVHAIMYFYYFLTACGYRPRWAKFVTVMQLSQMVVGVGVCVLAYFYTRVQNLPCRADESNLKWAAIMYSSYFMLFFKLFLDRYVFRVKNTTKVKKN